MVQAGEVRGEVSVEQGGLIEVNGGSFVDARIVDMSIGYRSVGGIDVGKGGVLNVSGGEVRSGITVQAGGIATLSAGSHSGVGVDSDFAPSGQEPGQINLLGASVSSLAVRDKSIGRISAGVVEGKIRGESSELSIAGGVIGDELDLSGSDVRISGGKVLGRLYFRGSKLSLFGSELSIDGTPIILAEGESLTITERDIDVSGVLSDGSLFEFNLTPNQFSTSSDFLLSSILTFTRVTQMQGDFNDDGVVDGADHSMWEEAIATGDLRADADYDGEITEFDVAIWQRLVGVDYSRLGDFNVDGVVDAADYTVWRDGDDPVRDLDRYYLWRDYFGTSYGNLSVAVPEPAAVPIISLVLACVFSRRFRLA